MNKGITTSTILAVALLLQSVITAPLAARPFTEGVQYQRISPAPPPGDGTAVEVMELFWYGCQTCFVIQPELESWLSRQGDAVSFTRIAAVTEDDMILLARAFYAAEALGVTDRMHRALYQAIHRDRRRLDSEAAVQAFFAEHGVSQQRFRSAFRSSFVAGRVRRARALAKRYGIRGVPTIVVNGRYRVDASMVRDAAEMMAVADFLVGLEHGRINKTSGVKEGRS